MKANPPNLFGFKIRRVYGAMQEMFSTGPLYVQVHSQPDQVPAEAVQNETVKEKMEGSRKKTAGTKDRGQHRRVSGSESAQHVVDFTGVLFG